MDLRQLISLLLLLFGLAAAIFAGWRFSQTVSDGGSGDSPDEKPNIVFILADDVGWNDIGYRNPQMKTPVMDQLAREGVIFDKYYTEMICTPSRAALLTGKYPLRFGLTHVPIRTGEAKCLDLNATTLPEKLKDAGYATHLVGKWHLGYYNESCLPTHRGFDTAYGFYLSGEDYYYKREDGSGMFPPTCVSGKVLTGYDFHLNDEPDFSANGSYSTFQYQDRAVKLIDEHDQDEGPMFLYMSFQAPHSPLQAPQEYVDMYSDVEDQDRRVFSAMMTAMDDAIGEIVQKLKDKGIYDNTLIVFSTDNGGDVMHGANNYPLRGNKATLWEGGVKGVAFASGGAVEDGGRTSDELIHISDWFPTILHAAGVEDVGDDLDSFNIWEVLTSAQGKTERTELVHNINPLFQSRFVWFQCGNNLVQSSQTPYNNTHGFDTTRGNSAYRMDNWKLLTGDPGPYFTTPAGVNPKQGVAGQLCAEDPQFSMGATGGVFRSVYLYDIDNDPGELTNLADSYPDVVEQMLGKIASYSQQAVPWKFNLIECESDPDNFDGVFRPWRPVV